ncbi:DUF938 domain-containing protein [Marinobacterium arenosum]|uniref:DUF938 domain-containing protein n=1 Tax=Marinobacterium arenosum TaxID=2862496 RepID=UPI001C94C623|nr:DUF938 domain-containing protein [Marinobacterium arenosum]MBY4675879.1 DUF938 domain-containing protein [Marinobacterium arenosum]
MLNFSEASERNKGPILAILSQALSGPQRVLEIGSGSGQHAHHFTEALPQLYWQCTELDENLAALQHNLAAIGSPALAEPVGLDVRAEHWPLAGPFDVVYSANTLHIMGWPEVEQFFAGVGRVLAADGLLLVYGPFRYGGDYTSPSNAQFDRWLQKRDPRSGIRDFEAVDALAREIGLSLIADHAMPANNQLLIWQRR